MGDYIAIQVFLVLYMLVLCPLRLMDHTSMHMLKKQDIHLKSCASKY